MVLQIRIVNSCGCFLESHQDTKERYTETTKKCMRMFEKFVKQIEDYVLEIQIAVSTF